MRNQLSGNDFCKGIGCAKIWGSDGLPRRRRAIS